ncbi:arylesterase [Rhizobium sp. LjRoot30]|uniref:arylesterase n=1 Tax=Rhizobium sp. LjRoot30 TaxID=3342320 RepID=UPI003ECC6D5E
MRFKAGRIHFIVIMLAMVFAVGVTPAAARTLQLVGFGDSLMAGYQLPPNDAYPARLEAALKAQGVDIVITNAGVSGDTTSAGLARVDWSVPDGTDGVILELGANDALRGIPPEETEKNLDAIISRLKERGIAVLLAGMLAPPNMGGDYAAKFDPIYTRLAEKHGVPLYPLFIDGVVTQAKLQLEDGMHPNADGVGVMVERSLPVVKAFVDMISSGTK